MIILTYFAIISQYTAMDLSPERVNTCESDPDAWVAETCVGEYNVFVHECDLMDVSDVKHNQHGMLVRFQSGN